MLKHIMYIVLILISLIIFLGCERQSPYKKQPVIDVAKTNEIRKQLGIREIKNEWEFYVHQFGFDKWRDNYECKVVKLNEELDRILWEQDYYYTGVTWTDYEGTHWEFLTITYEYTSKLFSIYYIGQQTKLNSLQEGLERIEYGFKSDTNEDTLKIADEMLKELGLTRL